MYWKWKKKCIFEIKVFFKWIFFEMEKYISKTVKNNKKMCKITTIFMSRIWKSSNTNQILIWKQNIYLHNMNKRHNITLFDKK